MNIYLISNESFRLINEEIKKIVKGNNYETFNLNKCSIKEVIEEASYFSLDSNVKYLVVSNANIFGSDKVDDVTTDLVLKYMTNPNPNTVLIFTTQKTIDTRKKIVKELKNKYKVINTPKMDRKSLSSFLIDYIRQNDFDIDYQTINYVINNSYNDLDIMLNELDKVMLYYNFPCRIKYDDVIKIVGEELDSNNFHFVNAVIEKNLANALKILNSLKVYKVDATVLATLLAREYRLMFYIKKLYQEKVNISEICSNLSLADWQVNKLYNNGLHYSEKELLRNLVDLCNIDMNIKKGIWDKDIALYGFLLDACV